MGKHSVKSRNLKNLKVFGQHLRKLRIEKGLTQEQVAESAKVSENTIVTLEGGTLNTSIATCFEVAKALGIPIRDLFDFKLIVNSSNP